MGDSGPEGRKDFSRVIQEVRARIRAEVSWLPVQRFPPAPFDFLKRPLVVVHVAIKHLLETELV